MIHIKKTWETVYFTASKDDTQSVTIELSLNHETKKYTLCTAGEEAVSFNGDCIEMSKLKLEALEEAMKYIESTLTLSEEMPTIMYAYAKDVIGGCSLNAQDWLDRRKQASHG